MSNWNDDRLDRRDQEVKEALVRLEGQMKEGFAKVDRCFATVDEQFERVDERFAKVDERLAQMATRQDMNEGFAEMRTAYAALTRTLLDG